MRTGGASRYETGSGLRARLEGVTTASEEEAAAEVNEQVIDVDALLAELYQRRGQLLARLLSAVLARGDEGFVVLEEFLEALTAARHGLAILREPKLAMPLFGVVLAREEEVAAFAEYLLGREPSDGRAHLVQGELLDYLAGFLAWDVDRFPSLRKRFADRLTSMLENPDKNLSSVLETMKWLGLKGDVETLEAVVLDPAQRRHHNVVIRELVRQDSPEAVLSLRRCIEGHVDQAESSSLKAALHAFVCMSEPSAVVALDDFIQSPVPDIGENAVLTYFSVPRDLGSLPLVLDLLNAGVNDARKRSLIWQLNSVNPELLEAIHSSPDAITNPEFRRFVEQTVRWSRTAGRKAVERLGLAATGRAIREYHPDDEAPPVGENPPTER